MIIETEKLTSLRTQILQLTLCSRHICHTQKKTHFTTSTPSLRNEEVSYVSCGVILVHNNLPRKQIQICPEPVVVELP